MSYSIERDGLKKIDANQADATLRLIASLPAPEGLEDRVHAHLRVAPFRSRVFSWPMRPGRETGWMRSAAAAAIVCLVAGGGWGIYSRVIPGQSAQTIAGQSAAGEKSFSTGEARRRPQTLAGPTAPPTATAKTAPAVTATNIASKPAAKHLRAAQVSAVNEPGNPIPVAPAQ